MSGQLPSQPAGVFIGRQRALAERLANASALLFAGGLRSRNYPANVYPYRADSHFLYLTGASLPGGALLIAEGRAELFLEPDAPDDALWHGATPSWTAIAERTGVARVRPLDELGAAVEQHGGAGKVATLPCGDPLTRAHQRDALDRTWPADRPASIGDLGDADLALADAMIALRLRHDEGALDNMRRAAEGTTAAHIRGMAVTRAGLREHDVRASMERELAARGMDCAYGSIVTVHGEILHNTTYHGELATGDLLLADLGGEHQGWASDVTRTWPVSGTFSATQRAIYDVVLQSQVDAIEMVRPGTRYRDVHLGAALTIARGLVDLGILKGDPQSLVERGAHALFFPHGVGHLLGLDVHDMEDLGDRAGYAADRTRSDQFGLGYLRLDRDLEPGLAVTIEPGFYLVPAILESDELCGPFDRDGTLDRERLAQFSDVRGIRIEDDVLCTPTGPEVLTAAIPKQPSDVEDLVGSTPVEAAI